MRSKKEHCVRCRAELRKSEMKSIAQMNARLCLKCWRELYENSM